MRSSKSHAGPAHTCPARVHDQATSAPHSKGDNTSRDGGEPSGVGPLHHAVAHPLGGLVRRKRPALRSQQTIGSIQVRMPSEPLGEEAVSAAHLGKSGIPVAEQLSRGLRIIQTWLYVEPDALAFLPDTPISERGIRSYPLVEEQCCPWRSRDGRRRGNGPCAVPRHS